MNEKKKLRRLPKRILSFVLTLVMVLGMLPSMGTRAFAASLPDYLTYSDNNTVVTGCDATKLPADGVIVIPEGIASIADDAFKNNDKITSVTILGKTSIGQYAFGLCTSLTSVSMPNVTEIKPYAFVSCGALASVDMPKVVTIGGTAFRYMGAASLTLPASLTSVGPQAFANSSLTSVTVTSPTTTFGTFCFRNVQASLTIPSDFSGTKPTESGSWYGGTFSPVTYTGGTGGTHTHSFATGWSSDATNHWHACTATGNTDTCKNEAGAAKAAHSGGTATCQTAAVCSVCAASYGKKAAHNYGYSAAGNVLTASCQTSGCTESVSLTLSASDENYSGSEVTASYGEGEEEAWKKAVGIDAPSIEYEAKDGSELTDGKAVKVGHYTAKITVGGETASIDFEIRALPPKFDSCGGSAVTLNADKNGPSANPTWKSYTFDGWYTSALGGTEKTTFSNGETYYAHWKSGTKTVVSQLLDFTKEDAPTSGPGFTWDKETNTLTLTNFLQDCSSNVTNTESTLTAIEFPAKATVKLSGDNQIISPKANAENKGVYGIQLPSGVTGGIDFTTTNGSAATLKVDMATAPGSMTGISTGGASTISKGAKITVNVTGDGTTRSLNGYSTGSGKLAIDKDSSLAVTSNAAGINQHYGVEVGTIDVAGTLSSILQKNQSWTTAYMIGVSINYDGSVIRSTGKVTGRVKQGNATNDTYGVKILHGKMTLENGAYLEAYGGRGGVYGNVDAPYSVIRGGFADGASSVKDSHSGLTYVTFTSEPTVTYTPVSTLPTFTYGTASAEQQIGTVSISNFESGTASYSFKWYDASTGGNQITSGTPSASIKDTNKVVVSTTATTAARTYYLEISATVGSDTAVSKRIAITINKGDYTGTKTASGELKAKNGESVTVTLPALPDGASYGTASNSNTEYFTVGTVTDGQITVTSVKDWDKNTEASGKTFTIPVTGATNYNNYSVEVTITPIFHSHSFTYAFAEDSNYKVIATCSDTDESCDLDDGLGNHSAVVVLPLSNAIVNDLYYVNTYEIGQFWTKTGLDPQTIQFFKVDKYGTTTGGTAVAQSDVAKEVGNYYGKLIVGDKTILRPFRVVPEPPSYSDVWDYLKIHTYVGTITEDGVEKNAISCFYDEYGEKFGVIGGYEGKKAITDAYVGEGGGPDPVNPVGAGDDNDYEYRVSSTYCTFSFNYSDGKVTDIHIPYNPFTRKEYVLTLKEDIDVTADDILELIGDSVYEGIYEQPGYNTLNRYYVEDDKLVLVEGIELDENNEPQTEGFKNELEILSVSNKSGNTYLVATSDNVVLEVILNESKDKVLSIKNYCALCVLLHEHDWKYIATGNKLEAYCANDNCTLGIDADHKLALTLLATSQNYSGSAYTGASLDKTAWEAAGLTAPTIKYVGTDDTTYTESTTAPTAVGTYEARITVGTATAVKAFSITDEVAPTAEINIDTNKWSSFLNTITFGTFFKETEDVTITASDSGSGVKKIEYYVSSEALTEEEVKALTSWTAYSDAFSISDDANYVIYAKATDKSGNVTYVSSNGVVIDSTAPVITGIEDEKTYCEKAEFTVADSNPDTVKVDGTAVTPTDGTYSITGDDANHTVVATDKSGNSTTCTITVKKNHTGGTATCQKKAVCEVCKKEYGVLGSHNYAETFTEDKAATCTEKGSKSKHCTVEGCNAKSEVTDIDPLGHVGGTATCQAKAICTRCEKEYGELADHVYATTYTTDKAATCTEKGSKSKHCTVEGCSAKSEVTDIAALGHAWTYVASAAEIKATCGNDNSHITILTLAADNEVYENKAYASAAANWDSELAMPQATLKYYLSDGTTLTNTANSLAASEGAAPVQAGSYVVKATITVGEKAYIAKNSFKITKHSVAAPKGITYDGEGNIAGLSADKKYEYKLGINGEINDVADGLTQISVKENGVVVPGTYYVRLAETTNEKPSSWAVVVVGKPAIKIANGSASEIGVNQATVGTKVTPIAEVNSVKVQYRKSGEAAWTSVSASTAKELISQKISTLTENTEYEYRFVATDKDGQETISSIASFKTEKSNAPKGNITGYIRNESLDEAKTVVISIEAGNTVLASQKLEVAANKNVATDKFTELPDGIYNIVLRTIDGDFEETQMITIENGNAEIAIFVLRKGELKSLVEVKSADTPKVAVDGLADIITNDEQTQAANGEASIEVKLEVEKKTASEAEGAQALEALVASNKIITTFLDMSLFKTTIMLDETGEVQSMDTENIGVSNTKVVEIAIPNEKGTTDIEVVRYHDGKAELLQKLDAMPAGTLKDGTYYVDANYIHVFASGFSTYGLIEPQGTGENEHKASSTYTYNDDNHWFVCAVAGCTTHQYNMEAHSYDATTHKCGCGKADIDAMKTDAKAAIDAEQGADTAANVVEEANVAKEAIEAAATEQEIETAKNVGIAAIKVAKEANANKTAFEEYKSTKKSDADKLLKEDDSDASKKLISDAKAAIDKLAYDNNKSLVDNKEAIDVIYNKLVADLEAQRKKDKDTQSPEDPSKPENPSKPEDSSKPENPKEDDTKPSDEEVKKNELAVNAKFKVTTYEKKVKVEWGKVNGADGYKVYITYCGKKMPTKATKVTKATSVTFKKLLGKKINPKNHVKVYVEAYKTVNGKDVRLCKTITAHAVGNKNKTATDAKKITLKKISYSLKVGKTATIKAKTIKKFSKKKLLTHTKEFRYATSDASVATVSNAGKITAKGKGTCTVYVYAVNGCAKKIKVTVK